MLKVDVDSKESHKVYSIIDTGFMAEKALKTAADLKTKKTVSDRDVMQFKMECKEFLVKVVKKIVEKSPLKFEVARSLSFLDPREMGDAAKKQTNLKRCTTV